MGWFYWFKLHLISNERGELLSFAFTKGNIDDRKPLEDKQFIKDIYRVHWITLPLKLCRVACWSKDEPKVEKT